LFEKWKCAQRRGIFRQARQFDAAILGGLQGK